MLKKNVGTVTSKYMGKLMENQGYFSRVFLLFVLFCASPFHRQLPVSAKNVVFFLTQGGHLSHGKTLCPTFRQKVGGQRPFHMCCFSSAFSSKESMCQSGKFLEWHGLKPFRRNSDTLANNRKIIIELCDLISLSSLLQVKGQPD